MAHIRPAGIARRCAMLLLLAPTVAQAPPPFPVRDGFAATTDLVVTRRPLGFGGFAPGAAPGELYYAILDDLWHRAADGTLTLVTSLANQARIGLLAAPPGSASLVYANFATDEIHVRDLATGADRGFPGLANTFDIDRTASGDLLASANPRWPAPGATTGIWLLDPAGAAHREIVRLSGASGPLHVDRRTGDLLYATQSDQYPAPPGSTRILRFASARLAAAIAGAPALTEADAAVAPGRLDGAYDLVADDRGAFYVTDPQRGGVLRLAPDGSRDALSPTTGRGTLGLAFVDGDAATFDPWQPERAARLLVAESDFGTWNAVHAITPQRPLLLSSPGTTIPPGPLRIDARGLPPRGQGFLLVGLPPPTLERAVASLDGVPVWSALDLAIPPVVIPVSVAADGSAQVAMTHPGGPAFSLAVQWLGVPTAPGRGIATSATVRLDFHP